MYNTINSISSVTIYGFLSRRTQKNKVPHKIIIIIIIQLLGLEDTEIGHFLGHAHSTKRFTSNHVSQTRVQDKMKGWRKTLLT